jgi:hypothetical protein
MAEVPPAKATQYLLSLESEDGHSKAVFFLSRGFSREASSVLVEALLSHIRSNDYVTIRTTPWGVKYVVDGPMQCPDAGTANVRSVWNIKPPATHPRLVTAHPLPRGPSQEH